MRRFRLVLQTEEMPVRLEQPEEPVCIAFRQKTERVGRPRVLLIAALQRVNHATGVDKGSQVKTALRAGKVNHARRRDRLVARLQTIVRWREEIREDGNQIEEDDDAKPRDEAFPAAHVTKRAPQAGGI